MSPLVELWHDDMLRKAMLADPRTALRRLDLPIPDDVAVKAVGSRGKPSDPVATLIQIVLERGPRFSFFFMPSPLHASAQQGAYGTAIGSSADDSMFEQRIRADLAAALDALGAPPPPERGCR